MEGNRLRLIKPRNNGYRGEPSKTSYGALLPGQRLCLALLPDGRRCVMGRQHKGGHKA